MKHKITKREYHYQCGEKCCDEFGTEWTLNGISVYSGPQYEEAFLNILKELGIQAEIVDLDFKTGEEVCALDNTVQIDHES
jgi:hypothetical protein